MNDRQLETFLVLAECGSFSSAEEQLFCSKQALTKRIAALENELGFALFLRSHTGIQLTEAGKDFYQGSKKFLSLKQVSLKKAERSLIQDPVFD